MADLVLFCIVTIGAVYALSIVVGIAQDIPKAASALMSMASRSSAGSISPLQFPTAARGTNDT
jgi:hypothetical protein